MSNPNPVKIVVGQSTATSNGVTIPITFQGLSSADAQKAAAVLTDLTNVVAGGHVNMFALLQLSSDLGLFKL
jgi:hypothetical protein